MVLGRSTEVRTLLGAFLLVFVGIGITINTVGVFIQAVTSARGFPTGPFAFVFSIGALVNIVGSIVVGRLLERFDHRKVMAVSICLLGVGMALYAAGQQVWHFYLVALITGSGTAGSHLLPATTFITRVFRARRGSAMAVVVAGNGLGGLVFNPVTRRVIETNPLSLPYGYQSAYILAGATVVTVSLPVALFLLPRLGDIRRHSGNATDLRHAEASLSVRQAIRTPLYWMVAFMMVGVSFVFMGLNQHLFMHFVEVLGFSGSRSSRLIGVMMGMTLPGAIVAGSLADRIGVRSTLLVFGAGLTVLLASTRFIATPASAWTFVMLYGFFNVLQTVVPPLLVADVFGSDHFSSLFGTLIVAQTLGAAAGPFVLGMQYQVSGHYRGAFALSLVVLVAAAGTGTFCRRRPDAASLFILDEARGPGPPPDAEGYR